MEADHELPWAWYTELRYEVSNGATVCVACHRKRTAGVFELRPEKMYVETRAMGAGWIACDLDGTLAYYEKFQGPYHIGEPIPLMLERVQRWLSEGRNVKIFTARIEVDDDRDRQKLIDCIQDWCELHIGQRLPVTATKDPQMYELYDDRAVQVEKNTGRLVGYSTRSLADEKWDKDYHGACGNCGKVHSGRCD